MKDKAPWIETYRPETLSDIIGQKIVINDLTSLIKYPKSMPHLLFTGQTGVGKTETAICIARNLLTKYAKIYVLHLNSTDERNIEVLRNKIRKFMKLDASKNMPYKIIILDDVEEMTQESQSALLSILDDMAESRFIMTARNASKIIEPLRSRCVEFKFSIINEKDIKDKLGEISQKENITVDRSGLSAIARKSKGDIRRAINNLQVISTINDSITYNTVMKPETDETYNEVLRVLEDVVGYNLIKSFKGASKLLDSGLTGSDFIKHAADISLNMNRSNSIYKILAEYDKCMNTDNQKVQIFAMLSEIRDI